MVAVRSSAVAEDLADASFAGQYLTVLGVDAADGGAVRAAISEVVASADTAHARSYEARAPIARLRNHVLAERVKLDPRFPVRPSGE